MKILFIAGFNNLGNDDYVNLDYIADDITFFYYDRDEKMASIENRLLKNFTDDTYDWIIANSMGAFFASRLLTKCRIKQNVLFICPYIETNFLTRLSCAIPSPYIPNWQFITNLSCRYKFKYIDLFIFLWVRTQLIKSVNNHMNTPAFLKTYKNHNVHVIYGSDDNLAKMSPMTIASLMTSCKVYMLHSKHDPFNDDIIIQNNLKRRVLAVLSSTKNSTPLEFII